MSSGRMAYWIWAAGLAAYVVAVFHRFSLGVAGVEAVERFGLSATGLGLFSVVQLGVYCVVQIPVGVLVDRFGYKRLLVIGAVVMAAGQFAFAFADDLPSALAARILLGFGDGLTFISMLRLVAAWFPPRRNPLLVQVTGLIGQLGAIASTVPLIYVLGHTGWETTFLGAAALGLLVAILAWIAVRERPAAAGPTVPAEQPTLGEVARTLRTTWAEPGTRLGLWTHFATQFPSIAFGLLWGYPFLVGAEGLSPASAGLLLTILTVSFMCCGPVVGQFVGRYPLRRSRMVLAVVGSSAIVWTAVLAWPGPAPFWLLLTLVVVMGANQPGSMIGFDYARTFNPSSRLGGAAGIVNMGGYVASLTAILLIGLVLSLFSAPGSSTYSPEAFNWAFAVQYPIWALGVVQVLRHRRKARRAYDGAPEHPRLAAELSIAA